MVTNSKTATKPYHHGDLREEILCAAITLLEENNIGSLSLRAVAKKVGVSHTAPYRHYKDKDQLLAGIAQRGYDELAKELAEAVEQYPDNPIEQLTEAGYRYVKMGTQRPQCTQLMFGGHFPCADTYPELRASGDAAFMGVKHIIEQGQLKRQFKKGDIETLALAAWSGIHGLTLLIISGSLPDILKINSSERELTAAITSTMLSGILAR